MGELICKLSPMPRFGGSFRRCTTVLPLVAQFVQLTAVQFASVVFLIRHTHSLTTTSLLHHLLLQQFLYSTLYTRFHLHFHMHTDIFIISICILCLSQGFLYFFAEKNIEKESNHTQTHIQIVYCFLLAGVVLSLSSSSASISSYFFACSFCLFVVCLSQSQSSLCY